METKSEISANYREEIRALHSSKVWPGSPNGVVFGAASNNIGEGIANRLHVTRFTKEELTLPNVPNSIAARNDFFIFNNGETRLDWIEDQLEGDIRSVIENSMTATIVAISKIAQLRMNAPSRTKIVVIGSMAHKGVLNGSSPYCAAKAGLQHFIRCIAYELAPKGFEIFCVNPTNVQDAPMSEETIKGLMRYRHLTREAAEAYWAAECPMGSFLTKGEIADVVEDLIVNDRKYLSGSAIDLIGGQR